MACLNKECVKYQASAMSSCWEIFYENLFENLDKK